LIRGIGRNPSPASWAAEEGIELDESYSAGAPLHAATPGPETDRTGLRHVVDFLGAPQGTDKKVARTTFKMFPTAT